MQFLLIECRMMYKMYTIVRQIYPVFFSSTAMAEIGGFESLRLQYMAAIPNATIEALEYNSSNASLCGIPTENAWHIFRAADAGDYPWPGVVFGIFLLSAQYFCTNQVNLPSQCRYCSLCVS